MKLIAKATATALVASLIVPAAFAQAPTTTAAPAAPMMKSGSMMKKPMMKKPMMKKAM